MAAVTAGIPLNLMQKWLDHAQLSTTTVYANARRSGGKGHRSADVRVTSVPGADIPRPAAAVWLDRVKVGHRHLLREPACVRDIGLARCTIWLLVEVIEASAAQLISDSRLVRRGLGERRASELRLRTFYQRVSKLRLSERLPNPAFQRVTLPVRYDRNTPENSASSIELHGLFQLKRPVLGHGAQTFRCLDLPNRAFL